MTEKDFGKKGDYLVKVKMATVRTFQLTGIKAQNIFYDLNHAKRRVGYQRELDKEFIEIPPLNPILYRRAYNLVQLQQAPPGRFEKMVWEIMKGRKGLVV